MLMLEALAEERIAQAMRRGEFDRLEGMGRPLQLEDDALVPEGLRVAYRILKNAGFLPPELEIRKEVRQVEALLRTLEDEGARRQALARLNVLNIRLSQARDGRGGLRLEQRYFRRVLERLGRGRG